MIKHLISSQIDHEKWDECINTSFNGNAYALSWFLNFAHPEWEALIDNDYETVMPLPVSRKYGISYVLQPFFIQQLGVFSKTKLYPDKIREFLDAIPSKVKYLDFNLNIHNKVDGLNLSPIKNRNYMLDLVLDYQNLKSNYNENTKRNLAKSLKNGLQLLKNIKPAELIRLFRENKGSDLNTFSDNDYKTLERIIYMSMHKGLGFVYGVYDKENQLCAAAFFLRHRNNLIFLFSGSNERARQNRAMFFLLDSIVKNNSPSPITLDFEGSNDDNLARFYKGFGAKEVFYNRLKINRAVFPLKNLINLYLNFKF